MRDFFQVRNILEIKKLLFSEFGLLNKWDKQIDENFKKGIEEFSNNEKIKKSKNEDRAKRI